MMEPRIDTDKIIDEMARLRDQAQNAKLYETALRIVSNELALHRCFPARSSDIEEHCKMIRMSAGAIFNSAVDEAHREIGVTNAAK
jgi:hypothetical protein